MSQLDRIEQNQAILARQTDQRFDRVEMMLRALMQKVVTDPQELARIEEKLVDQLATSTTKLQIAIDKASIHKSP